MSDLLIRVTAIDYRPKQDEGDPTVIVCGRSADGDRVRRYVNGCWPHCYIPENDDLSDGVEGAEIRSIESGYESYDGQSVKRVTVSHPKQINAIEEAARYTWESDFPFFRRVTWDYDLSGYVRVPEETNCSIDHIETDIDSESVETIEPRSLIGDIEVDPSDDSFREMQEQAERPVISFSAFDTYSEEFFLGLVDPEEQADGAEIKAEMRDHWDDHDLAAEMVDDADITFLQVDTETDLLNAVIGQVIEWQPDLLSGWNWIDFDHQYLLDRMRKLDDVDHHLLSDVGSVGGYKTETLIDGIPGFDQMAAYEDKVTRSENRSSSLEYVANEELDIGKVDSVDISESYAADRSRLAAYNLLDVQLCVALTDVHSIEEFYFDLAQLSGIQVYDAFSEKRLVDGWIASRRDDDQILPNETDREIPEPAGGLVLTPSDGVSKNVAVLDLKSLYPSSIITANISPETMTDGPDDADVVIPGMPETESDAGGSIDEDDLNWDDWDDDLPWSLRPKGFRLDQQGLIAEAAEGPFFERKRYKTLRNDFGPDEQQYLVYDRKQGAVKVVHNSMYGVLNSSYYRLATPGMGDSITGVSRYVLWRAAEYIDNMGYDVVYGDTDSVLVQIPDDKLLREKLLDAKGICNELNSFMDEVATDLGIPEDHPFIDGSEMPHEVDDDTNHLWSFEFEKFYDSFVQYGKKKRYAGKLAWKEGKKIDGTADPDITGFESQRADVPKVTAEVQTQIIKMVLNERSFDEVSDYLQEEIEKVRQASAIDEIGIPKSISKPLDEYPNGPRVRAAQHSNEYLGSEFGPGDTYWMFYAARVPTGIEGTDVFGVEWNEEIPSGYEIDEEKTITKSFESALEPIIEEVGWTFSELRSGKQAQAAEEGTGFEGDPFDEDEDPSDGSDEEDEWEGAEQW